MFWWGRLVFPRLGPAMLNVLLMPSLQTPAKGTLATELRLEMAPRSSRPCVGFAPGAKGAPAARPSGVAPVCFPYITFEVMVSTESVGSQSR